MDVAPWCYKWIGLDISSANNDQDNDGDKKVNGQNIYSDLLRIFSLILFMLVD